MNERFTPWFGDWPPKIQGECKELKMSNKPSRIFTKTNIALMVSLVLGKVCFLVAYYFTITGTLPRDIFSSLGIAFFTASILGFAVDKILKRELASEAVKTAIGYLLPDELKAEMRWVVDLKFLAIDHTTKYEIRLNKDDKSVCLYTEMVRRLKNFTETPQEITPKLSIDELGVEGLPSKIVELCYRLEGKNWIYVDTSKTKVYPDTLELESKKEKVPSGEWIEIKYKYHITKMVNDVEFMVITYPTTRPMVNVFADDGIEYRKGFTHRSNQAEESDMLQGTLLPYQSLYVRWWSSKQKDIVR